MGECNYCSYKKLKKRAKEKGMVVKKLPSTWKMGHQLFIVPKTITIQEIRTWKEPSDELPNGDKNWEKYSCGWMMVIPKECWC